MVPDREKPVAAAAQVVVQPEETREQGEIVVDGETVRYELYGVDARSPQQRARNEAQCAPDGNIIVVIPGHGQTVDGPRHMVLAAASLSRARIAWCIDPVPARGGDRIEARAIARIVRTRIEDHFPGAGGGQSRVAATLVGWSHGGGEALRAANEDWQVFPQFLGLCPTGIVERQPLELVRSFEREGLRILWQSSRRRDWAWCRETLRLAANLVVGVSRDLIRSRSVRRVVEDIGWASTKVPDTSFGYRGEIVLLWADEDTVVRWRDAFPECAEPCDIPAVMPAFRQRNFPHARRVVVDVIEGDHVTPEVDAPAVLGKGLYLLGQL